MHMHSIILQDIMLLGRVCHTIGRRPMNYILEQGSLDVPWRNELGLFL